MTIVLKDVMNTYCFHDGYYDVLKAYIRRLEKDTMIDLAGSNFTAGAFNAIRELSSEYRFVNTDNKELNEILQAMRDDRIGEPLIVPTGMSYDDIVQWVQSLSIPIYYAQPGYDVGETIAIILAVAERVDLTFDISARYTEIAVFLENNCKNMLDNTMCYYTDGRVVYPNPNVTGIIGRIPVLLGVKGISLSNPDPKHPLVDLIVGSRIYLSGYSKLTDNLRRELLC